MKSARIPGPNEPLEVVDLETPKPRESQVIVKVKAVGYATAICIFGKVVMIWGMANL